MADAATVANLQRRQRLLGRFSGPEFFFNQAFAINTAPFLTRPIPIGEALESIRLVFRGRLVIGTADYTTAAAEIPQSLLTNIMLSGISAPYGQQTLLNMSGATLFALQRCFKLRGNSLYVGNTTSQTRAADLNVPNNSSGNGMAALVQGTYDIEQHFNIPLTPFVNPHAQIDALSYMLRPEDWQQGLALQLTWGGPSALGTAAGGTTSTWTAWGSAAGSPSMYVYLNTCLLGELRKTYPSAIVTRTERPVPASVGQTAANNVLLQTLSKTRTTSIVIKQGLSLAASPSTTFASLSELQLGNLQLQVNNNPIRNFQDWWAMKEYYGEKFGTIIPGGYNLISFVESGRLGAQLSDAIDASARFDFVGNVLTTGATQQQTIIQEQVLGDPQNRLPGQR